MGQDGVGRHPLGKKDTLRVVKTSGETGRVYVAGV